MVQALSRRDRLRAATTQEIIETARRLLVTEGPDAATLRAIAREMGMTAPALYRYFSNHEELLRYVIADVVTELAGSVSAAIGAAAKDAAGDTGTDVVGLQLLAGCRAFRAWTLEHVQEFSLVFGSPLPGMQVPHAAVGTAGPDVDSGYRFARVFLDLFGELYAQGPFPIPADSQIEPSLRGQLARYRQLAGTQLPLGALQVFLRCWVLLYGAISMEVFGHLEFALEDASPMFELMLADMAALVGRSLPDPPVSK
jgi:AcrR family transcriptional regulator